MVTVCFNDEEYHTLIRILQEKYYSTTKLSELEEINQLYKSLNCEAEVWLSEWME